MYRQHLHRQAITNSYCCKRLKELQKEFMALQKEYTSIHKELEDLEKDKEQLVHEVTSAYRTIDTIELLGKNESALKHDIRSLIGKKEGDIASVEAPSGKKEFEILNISYEVFLQSFFTKICNIFLLFGFSDIIDFFDSLIDKQIIE